MQRTDALNYHRWRWCQPLIWGYGFVFVGGVAERAKAKASSFSTNLIAWSGFNPHPVRVLVSLDETLYDDDLLGGFEQAANLRERSQTLIQTWCYGSTIELSLPSFGSSRVALAPLGRLPWGSTTATRRPSPTVLSRACPEAMDQSWFLGVTRVRLLAPVISIHIKFYQRKRT